MTTSATSALERKLWRQGFSRVCGVDEAGRGALAGPLVAAAVVLPRNAGLMGVRDSKKLTAGARDRLFDEILDKATLHRVIVVGHEEIDELGIHHANIRALQRAVDELAQPADYVLSDGFALPAAPCPGLAVPKGDAVSVSVAAASIIAKVSRDRLMLEADTAHPEYGFARHKGYGTAAHQAALRQLGVTEIHRRTYAPIRAAAERLR